MSRNYTLHQKKNIMENFIEIPAKPVEHDGDKLYIMVYSWIIVESKASVKTVTEWLEGLPCFRDMPNCEHSKITCYSELDFLSKEEAMQDGEKFMMQTIKKIEMRGDDMDNSHLVLLHKKVEAPNLSQILRCLVTYEAFKIMCTLLDNHDSLKNKRFCHETAQLKVWQNLDANINNIFCWMNAVLKKMILAASTNLPKGSTIDVYDFDIYTVRKWYKKIKKSNRIFSWYF